MRIKYRARLVVLVLTSAGALAASEEASSGAREPAVRTDPRPEWEGQEAPPAGDDLDLGTAVPTHGSGTVGPFSVSVGIANRVQVGTRLIPWFVGAAVSGSIVPNAFVKGLVASGRRWSVATETSLFYAHLDDLDGDDLNVRAVVWPTRLLFALDWTSRFSQTVELAGVYVAAVARKPADTDTWIEGVALARSAYVGIVPRYRALDWFTLWFRYRLLLGHSPVVARAKSTLSETSSFRLEARADAAELTSGGAAVAGVHLHKRRFSTTVGAGYGTWFLPWIYLPVGHSTAIFELDFYYRF